MAASRHFLRKVWAVPATRLCVSNQRRTITQNSIRCFASTKEEAPELPNGFLFNEKVNPNIHILSEWCNAAVKHNYLCAL